MSVRSPPRRSSITSHREFGRARSSSLHRSVSPRSDARGRSITRSPSYERDSNGARLRNRSFSRSRPMSRSRSPSRGRGRGYRSRSRSYTPIRDDSPPRSSKVVVEKLTKNVTEGHLREIFGRFGDIQNLDLPINRSFMTNRGTAYVLYYDPADAEAAIAHMHEAQLDGAVLNVSIVLPRRAFSRSPPPAQTGGPGFGRSKYGSGHQGRSPPPRRYGRNRPVERHDLYRPRSSSRSLSPRRSRSFSSRSPSRSPPRRRTPKRRGRRSPSYSSYSSRSDRSPSLARNRSRSRH